MVNLLVSLVLEARSAERRSANISYKDFEECIWIHLQMSYEAYLLGEKAGLPAKPGLTGALLAVTVLVTVATGLLRLPTCNDDDVQIVSGLS